MVWILVSLVIFLTGFLAQLYAHNTVIAILVTAGLGLADALLWPVLTYLTLPFTIVTFGLSAFIVNGALFWGAALLFPQVKVTGWGLFMLPGYIAIINTAVSGILTFNNDASFYHVVSRKTNGRAKKAAANRGKPGFIFLEIDGLSEAVFRKAIEDGTMPTLAAWVKNGTHRIKGWETDFSSQTAASQAGILHGNNQNIPAFHWVEKAEGNNVVSSAGFASAIESRISDGHGLLAVNGRAAVNMYSGDAADNVFVYSKFRQMLELYRQSGSFSAASYNFVHTGVHMVWEMVREARSRFRQRRKNVRPRLDHPGTLYYFTRAFAAGFLRELTTYTVVGDIIAGDKDVIYSSFLGYDEVAHHCGVSDEEAMYALHNLDKSIERIAGAREYARRPYNICVLSDHGQSNGATFKQRYGCTLAQLVQKLVPAGHRTFHDLDSNQDHFGEMVTTPLQTARKPLENVKNPLTPKPAKEEKPDVIVLASGNMGLIYFTRWPERLTIEHIEKHYPGMVEGLSLHEGISFVVVLSKEAGGIVIGPAGKHYLKDDKVEGEDPLAKFGQRTASHLRRLDSFDCVPDILLISMYDTEKDEVAAFEELVGSHGGVGGNQSKPFILHPAEWNVGEAEIIGAEKVGKLFNRQIAEVMGKWGKDNSVPTDDGTPVSTRNPVKASSPSR